MTPEFAGPPYADKVGVAVPRAIGIRAGSFLRRKTVPASFSSIPLHSEADFSVEKEIQL